MSPEVAQALGALLPDGALVYVSSDVPAVTEAAAAALATQSTLVRCLTQTPALALTLTEVTWWSCGSRSSTR